MSKAWNWEKEENKDFWINCPAEDSYYIAHKWKKEGKNRILDLGCGLGRHSVLFGKLGFDVTGLDLSEEAVEYTKQRMIKEGLNFNDVVGDMQDLPFEEATFDAIWSYMVISHTDTKGFKKILNEIKRVSKDNAGIFITLCSKETWSYKDAGYPKIDENSIIKTGEGPEKGIVHYYVDLDDILNFMSDDFEIVRIRHIDSCYFDGKKQNSKHYYIEAIIKK